MATSLTLQNDASLAQGYVKVNGTTSATFTTSGITGNLTGNVTGNLTGNVTGNLTGSLTAGGSLTLATAQTATGTAVDFTGIPSWVKRITVIFSGVRINGSSQIRVQIGSGSIQTSSYNNRNTLGTTGWNAVVTSINGFEFANTSPRLVDGTIVLHNPFANTWIASGLLTNDTPAIIWTGGNTGLSGSLDRVRITTSNGTDLFNAGAINLIYEG